VLSDQCPPRTLRNASRFWWNLARTWRSPKSSEFASGGPLRNGFFGSSWSKLAVVTHYKPGIPCFSMKHHRRSHRRKLPDASRHSRSFFEFLQSKKLPRSHLTKRRPPGRMISGSDCLLRTTTVCRSTHSRRARGWDAHSLSRARDNVSMSIPFQKTRERSSRPYRKRLNRGTHSSCATEMPG
jgi:hypothetical protein